MKRSLIMLLATIICAASFILPVAAESTDSLHLSSEEESLLKPSSDDTVIKLFSGAFMKDFATQEDIPGIVEEPRISYVYMIVKKSGEIAYYHNYDGEMVKLNSATGLSDWSDFYTYAVSPNTVFDPSVKVNRAYCLDGDRSQDGVYIYYETDHGKYVLFKEYLSADKTYLFPISDFYEISEVVYSNRLLHKDTEGGAPPIDELFDVENYLFQPKSNSESNFDWMTIGLIIGIVLVVVGGVLYLFHRRKASKR